MAHTPTRNRGVGGVRNNMYGGRKTQGSGRSEIQACGRSAKALADVCLQASRGCGVGIRVLHNSKRNNLYQKRTMKPIMPSPEPKPVAADTHTPAAESRRARASVT